MTATSAPSVPPCALDSRHMSTRSNVERRWHGEWAWRRARHGGVSVGGAWTVLLFSFLTLFLSAHAQSPDQYAQNRTALNIQIYDAAFRFLNTSKITSGNTYDVPVPAGVNDKSVQLEAIQVVRVRTGSLRRRGITVNEITLPKEVKVVETRLHVVLVYRRFSQYAFYDSTNETVFVSTVVGIIVYNYGDISNYKNNYGQELTLSAPASPVQVQLQSTRDIAVDQQSCIFYDNTVNGTASGRVENVTASGLCSWTVGGDYALLGPPEHHRSNTWKIVVGSVVGGIAAIVLLVLVGFLVVWYRRKARFANMEHKSDQGESLQHTWFGTSRAPSAAGTRTKPVLETENV